MSGGPVYLNRGNRNHLLMLMGTHGRGEAADTGAGLVKTNFNFGISSYNAIDFISNEIPDFVNSHILSNVKTGKYKVYHPTGYSNYTKDESGNYQRCIYPNKSKTLRSFTVNKRIKNGLNVTFQDAYVNLDGNGSKWRPWTADCFIGGSPEAVRLYRGYTIGTSPTRLYCEFTNKNPNATKGDPLNDIGTTLVLEPNGNDPAPVDFSQINVFSGNSYIAFPH